MHASPPGAFVAELKQIVRLALPVVGTQLAFMLIGVADVVMAGQLSALDLAAVSVGWAYQMPIYLVTMGILMLVNPIVAHLYGAGRHGEIGGKLHQCLWLALFLTVPAVVLMRSALPILRYMEVEPEVAVLAGKYLDALSLGFVCNFTFMAIRFFNEGLGYVKPTAVVLVIAVPLNVLGNYALMYGHFGFPALGAVGTGYASSLVILVMVVMLAAWTFRTLGPRYQLARFVKPRLADLREQLGIGLPSGLSLGMEVTMFALIAMYIANLGSAQVGAHQIALNFSSVTFMVPLGISLSLGIRIGQAAGAGQLDAVMLSVKVGLWLTLALQLLLALMMFLFNDTIVTWYTHDPEVAKLAATLLLYAAVFQVSDGFQVVGSGALRGLKDTKIPMWANFIAYWGIGLPLGLLLGRHWQQGPTGYWLGLVMGLTAAALMHNGRLLWLVRKRVAQARRPVAQGSD